MIIMRKSVKNGRENSSRVYGNENKDNECEESSENLYVAFLLQFCLILDFTNVLVLWTNDRYFGSVEHKNIGSPKFFLWSLRKRIVPNSNTNPPHISTFIQIKHQKKWWNPISKLKQKSHTQIFWVDKTKRLLMCTMSSLFFSLLPLSLVPSSAIWCYQIESTL